MFCEPKTHVGLRTLPWNLLLVSLLAASCLIHVKADVYLTSAGGITWSGSCDDCQHPSSDCNIDLAAATVVHNPALAEPCDIFMDAASWNRDIHLNLSLLTVPLTISAYSLTDPLPHELLNLSSWKFSDVTNDLTFRNADFINCHFEISFKADSSSAKLAFDNCLIKGSSLIVYEDYLNIALAPQSTRYIDFNLVNITDILPESFFLNMTVINSDVNPLVSPPFPNLTAVIRLLDVQILDSRGASFFSADRAVVYSTDFQATPPSIHFMSNFGTAYSVVFNFMGGSRIDTNAAHIFDYFPHAQNSRRDTSVNITIAEKSSLSGRFMNGEPPTAILPPPLAGKHSITLLDQSSISRFNLTFSAMNVSEGSVIKNCNYYRARETGFYYDDVDTLNDAVIELASDSQTNYNYTVLWTSTTISARNLTLIDTHPTANFRMGTSTYMIGPSSIVVDHLELLPETSFSLTDLTITRSLFSFAETSATRPWFRVADGGGKRSASSSQAWSHLADSSSTLRRASSETVLYNLTLENVQVTNVDLSLDDSSFVTVRPSKQPNQLPIITMINATMNRLPVNNLRIIWDDQKLGAPPNFRTNYRLIDGGVLDGPYDFNSTMFAGDKYQFRIYSDQGFPERIWFTPVKDYTLPQPSLIPQPTSTPHSTTPAPNCPYPPPFVCTPDGHVIVNGSVNSNTSFVVPAFSGSVVIRGNLTLTSGSIIIQGAGTTLNVTGCINVTSGVVIDLSRKGSVERLSKSSPSTLIQQNGNNCSLDISTLSVSVKNSPDDCKKAKSRVDASRSSKDSLVVLFEFDNSSCNVKWIIVGSVLGALFIIAVIAILIIWKVFLDPRKKGLQRLKQS